jgi:vitamin B12 transporter
MKIKFSKVGPARSRLLVFFVATIFVAPLLPANAAGQLPEVVVTPSRTEQRQTETLLHSTVITSEMIKNSQQPDLPSLLRAEAGIQITQTGGIGTATGFFMRGAATRQTLVLVDGVPITKQDATGTVSIEHLMLAEIDHIEIVRGNVSSIYGSGAVGGVIQIFTRRPSEKPTTSMSAEFGSRMSYNSAASIRGATEDIRYALSASALGTDGFSAINNRQLTSGNPDRDGYTNLSASGSISKQWSADHEVGIRFTQSQGRFSFDSRFDQPADKHTGKTNVSLVSLFANNRVAEHWQSNLTFSEAIDRNTNRYQTAFPVSDRYRTKTQMADWLNRIDLSDVLRTTTGLTYQRQSLVADDGYGGLSDFSRNIWSAQAGLEYAGKNGHGFQLNGRHDGMQGNTSTNTGLFGYGYRVNETIKLIASTSTGFGAPPLGYLYGQYGNPSLRPEFSRSTDIGAQISLSEFELRVTWFNSRIRDQIEYSNGFKNIGAARNDGVEISGQFSLGDWSIRPSLTLQNPRDIDTGQRLARRARELASVSAVRSSGPWTINISASYAGTRFDGDNQLRSYVLAGLSSSYKLSKEWSLISRIDNLFDASYQSVYGYNQPPRTIFAGVRWQQ